MAVEIEAKMEFRDFDAARGRLRELGAKAAGSVLETNVILDTAGGNLFRKGSGLRVRQARDLTGDGQAHSTSSGQAQTVTFKGPRHYGPLKSREELEVAVSHGDAAALLERLGFVPVLTFEKRRETWELEGCKIELDELPLLGRFVEIEGPAEEVILRLRERLGLAGHPLIKSGYVELLMTYLTTHDAADRTIRFAP